jgi:CDP-paratose 2-epimerase
VRDILHVDDFSRACESFINSGRQYGLYNLGGGKKNSASLREIIQKIGRLIELEPVIDQDNILPDPIPVNYVSDLTRVRDELRWEPQIDLDLGLRSLL